MLEPKKREIGFAQIGLGSILRQNQLVVPTNQREYAWGDEGEVTELFQDFARALRDDADYFLGTIVTIPRHNGSLEVVDGQQRLATTAILLAAIRDYLREQNESVLVEAINNEFLTGIDRARRERVPKLRLNVDDNDLFSRIVTSTPLSDPTVARLRKASHRRLLAAYDEATKHVRNVVASLDKRDHGDVLNNWVSFIEHRALAVLLRVPDDADAYKMFETLNDRGLRTSQSDLVKNYLFGRAGERIGEVHSRWSYMRGTLESFEEEDITVTFLRHALIVLGGFLREADVYTRVQESVRSEQAAVTFASQLDNLSTAYVATFNPEHERWNTYPDGARRAIEVFNLLNIRPMRPLLLAISARMDQREAPRAFQLLLSLGVRLLIAATTRSGSVETPLAIAAYKVFDGTIDTATKLRAQLASIMPGDQEFREAFETARVSQPRFARYYLRSLEMAAKCEPEPWFVPTDDRAVINLEHVLPKKSEGHWPQFSDETAAILTNRLGNLCLMRASDNANLKSDSFADKKVVYARSPYLLTSQIAQAADWTPTAIVERQRKLADIALKTWPSKV